MDPSAARYLEALTAEVTAVLGGRLVGVYAHGSLLLGGYLPTRSDIDVLVVVEDPLSPGEQADLAARLSEDALPCPAVGLELSVVLRSVAAAPTARPAFELHVTTAPQDRKVVDGHGHPGDLDLVLHFAVCHALGYAPFAEVPPSLVLAQVADELDVGRRAQPVRVRRPQRLPRLALRGRRRSRLQGRRRPLGRAEADRTRTNVGSGCTRPAVRRGDDRRSTPTSSARSPGASGTSYESRPRSHDSYDVAGW